MAWPYKSRGCLGPDQGLWQGACEELLWNTLYYEETALGCRLWKHWGATPRPEGAEGVAASIVPSTRLSQVFLQHRDAVCSMGHIWGDGDTESSLFTSTAASAELWAQFLLSSHHCLYWERLQLGRTLTVSLSEV